MESSSGCLEEMVGASQGVADSSVTVPCMFWSSEVAFHAAARNLANIRGSREAIYRATARLRSALRDVGAFVGWLPMDVGCAMDSRLTGSMRVYEDGARSSPSQTLRRSTSSAYLSVTDTRGAEREALSWSHPIRHDTPRRQQRDDGYRESYQILGPDAAFLLYDFDRRVISFDVSSERVARGTR